MKPFENQVTHTPVLKYHHVDRWNWVGMYSNETHLLFFLPTYCLCRILVKEFVENKKKKISGYYTTVLPLRSPSRLTIERRGIVIVISCPRHLMNPGIHRVYYDLFPKNLPVSQNPLFLSSLLLGCQNHENSIDIEKPKWKSLYII